ncbi:hypothetical protein HMPREF2534_01525 [Bacteroides thetaiotaomicron]|nr:hypothetical protein HMPREF2534_01525 [Bacteroides thetaiotaomicron]
MNVLFTINSRSFRKNGKADKYSVIIMNRKVVCCLFYAYL